MQITFVILAVSTLTLIMLIGVFRVEDARGGKRVLFPRLRTLLDKGVRTVVNKMLQVDTYLGRGVARLTLHYAAHSILQRVLAWVSRTEQKLEHLLLRNKQVVKEIRTDKKKNHLDALTEHKEETALSESQKKKMRSHQ